MRELLRLAQGAYLLEDEDKAVLHEVLRRVAVGGKTHADAQRHGGEGIVECALRAAVAAAASLHYCCVVCFHYLL
jgi:hypothetical protein